VAGTLYELVGVVVHQGSMRGARPALPGRAAWPAARCAASQAALC
jgi:hypothetical protein